jgi:hypothetical protein
MTSILAAQSHTFPTNHIMAQIDTSAMSPMHDPALQRRPKSESEEKNRGRRRSRATQQKNKEGSVEGSPGEGADGHSSGSDGGPSRKRRRSRKGLDKKFECPQEGCGKSYSRAEHL